MSTYVLNLFICSQVSIFPVHYRKIHSSTKVEICKYFVSPRGCVRGAKCFYAHGMEEHQKVKQEAVCNHSHDAKEIKRIFVGGLPPSVGSG